MKRYSYKKYLIFGLIIVSVLSASPLIIEKLRRGVALSAFPLWKQSSKTVIRDHEKERLRLEGENHLLKIEMGKLRAIVEQGSIFDGCLKELDRYSAAQMQRRYEENCFLLGLYAQAVPARVIYRDPASWGSSLWINVGEETNFALGKKIILKNSPVILGRSIVGAIDYVGKKQSRVRLITDHGIKPSVRAVRGYPQNAYLIENIECLLRSLHHRQDLPLEQEEVTYLVKHLEKLKTSFSQNLSGWHLAKGIIQGAGHPLWRGMGILKGVGFNYDFADDEGPSRDLLTGKPEFGDGIPAPLIQMNDLLVTTGMDGVFPQGLKVAEVTKVFPLREGAYTYEIEAIPTVGNLDELQCVFVIPSIGYDSNDQSKW